MPRRQYQQQPARGGHGQRSPVPPPRRRRRARLPAIFCRATIIPDAMAASRASLARHEGEAGE